MTPRELIKFIQEVAKEEPAIMDNEIVMDDVPAKPITFGWSAHSLYVLPERTAPAKSR